MPPWYALLTNLSYAPTFPLLIGVLRSKGLLPDSGDGYEDGLLLFQSMATSDLLDNEQESVSIELCGTLKVPVFRIRGREMALYGKSVFPGAGKGKGRLSVSSLVVQEKLADLDELYDRFYHSAEFGHDEALQSGRLSRHKERQIWEELEDDPYYDEAIEVLEEYADDLTAIRKADE